MNTVVGPFEMESVVTIETVVRKEEISVPIVTTLYDLVTVVQSAMEPGEDVLVVPIVSRLLRLGRVTFLGDIKTLDR